MKQINYKNAYENVMIANKMLGQEIERLQNIIKEQDKELELERKSRQLLTDDLANVCEISLKKDNIIKEAREYINWRLEEHQDMYKYQMEELLEILDKENK